MASRHPPRRGQPTAGRTVLYVRVSSVRGREGDEFHSPAMQIDGMRRAAARADLHEVAVVDDDVDVSGRTFDRPGLNRIRAMVEAGQVDVIAVNTLNRIGRNLSESLTLVKWFRSHHVGIISATEPVDDTPEGQFMLGMWLNLAELQSNQIGVGWARVIERRARDGKPHARPAIGYAKAVDGRLVEDPLLGPAMRAAFAGYAAGEPVVKLCQQVAEARGRPLRKAAFKRLLRNPVYRGLVEVDSATGGRISIAGEHEPLCDEDTWLRVELRLATESVMPPRHLEPAYPLTGLLLCSGCGLAVQAWPMVTPQGVAQLRARCMRKVEAGACPGVGTPLYDRLEAEILRRAAEYAQYLRGNTAARARQRARAAQASADVPALRRELDKTREAMARLTERWARQRMPESAYDTTMARLAQAEAEQQRMLASARTVAEAPAPSKVVALVEEMLELWPVMTNAEKNRALRSVVASVTLRKAAYYREPEEDRIVEFKPRW